MLSKISNLGFCNWMSRWLITGAVGDLPLITRTQIANSVCPKSHIGAVVLATEFLNPQVCYVPESINRTGYVFLFYKY